MLCQLHPVDSLRCLYIKPFPAAPSDQVCPWFLPMGYLGRGGGDKIYRHNQDPFFSNFGQDSLPGIFLSPSRHTARATCPTLLYWISPAHRGKEQNHFYTASQNFLPRNRAEGRNY